MTATPATNVATPLWDAAARDGGAPALCDGATTVTYGALRGRAAAIGSQLIARGIAPGDRVAVFLERNAEAVASIYGVLAAGAVVIVVNDRLRPRQIERTVSDSGARLLLTSSDLLDRMPRPLETQAGIVLVARLDRSGDLSPVPRAGSDHSVIIYTSGSSGLPKGVAHTHASIGFGVRTCAEYLGLRASDRVASLLSLSTVYGLNQLLSAVTVGAALVLIRSPMAAQLDADLRAGAVTVAAGVPPLWLQLLGVPQFRERPVPTLRQMQNAGGHLPAEVVRRLRLAQPQADLVLQYGMTEVIRTTYLPPVEVDRHPDSMGRPIPGIEVVVVRDDGSTCGPNEVGELVHCGPTIAAGYWNEPDATLRVFRPHPLKPGTGRAVFSGDMVRRDDDGLLYFVSRRDRLIKTLGYRVGPDEVGDVLHASGEIEEAVVVGEPHRERGEAIVAYVVLRPDGSLDRLGRYCRAELPAYMLPARITPVGDLPRLPSGKYDLPALRERLGAPTA